MPRPAGVSRYTLYGHLAGGEEFNTSFWMDAVYDSDGAAGDAVAAVIGYFVTDCSAAVKAIMQASAAYDGLRLYEYPDAGPAPAARVTDVALGTPVVGTAAGNGLNQACLVATLLTGSAGRRNRGRMYLPATGLPVTSGLANLSSTITSVANSVRTFFSDLNGSVNVNGSVVVVSSAGSASRPVTTVRVDNKPDIQRRRADALVATFTASADV